MCYDTDLSHFEESHSSEKRVAACLMLWPNPLQLQLVCYFLQSTLQVLATLHKILKKNYEKWLHGSKTQEVWQKSNETDFLLTINFIHFTNQGYPLQNSPLGSYTATEALFPLFVAVLEGFCWNTFQLVGYTLLDIIQSTKMAPFEVVFEPGE